MMPLPSPPAFATDDAGMPRYGAYAGVLEGADLVAAHAAGLGSALATPPGKGFLGRASAALRRLRHKRWVYVAFLSDRVIAGMAVIDVGYMGGGFAYAFDRERADFTETSWLLPGGPGVRVAPGFAAGITEAVNGAKRVRFDMAAAPLRLAADVSVDSIEVEATVADLDTPLSVLTDLGGDMPGATIKAAGAPATGGVVRVKGREIPLAGAHATVDWTHGFFPYHTVWNWAAAAGPAAAGGGRVGLNLCRGVHEDPAGRFSENALWLDGRPAALPRVEFAVPEDPKAPWHVRTASPSRPGANGTPGLVDLTFHPLGERAGDVNAGVILSQFRQPFGTFEGTLRDLEGREARLAGVPGVVEDHIARW
jgi:hypothetical protein